MGTTVGRALVILALPQAGGIRRLYIKTEKDRKEAPYDMGRRSGWKVAAVTKDVVLIIAAVMKRTCGNKS